MWFAKLLMLFESRATRDANAATIAAAGAAGAVDAGHRGRNYWMLLRYLDDVTDSVARPHVPNARHFQFTRGRLYVEELAALINRVTLVRSPRKEGGRSIFLQLPYGKSARLMSEVYDVMRT